MSGALSSRIVQSVEDVDRDQWNGLGDRDNPFIRHEFLAALERHGCANADTGWQPQHLVLQDSGGRLAAAMPLYLKDNSWGEFVFDWSWANAYHDSGVEYYPKLVGAIPFTPATGPRMLTHPSVNRSELLGAALAHAEQLDLSSLHVLFPETGEVEALRQAGLLIRQDCQFHWHNRDYATFEDFLATFRSVKRKKARRERRRVYDAGIRFRVFDGAQIDADTLDVAFALHAATFFKRRRPPYLNREFFDEICATMPESIIFICAMRDSQMVAAAICFRGTKTLYGRYWGCLTEYHSLHFETCYYQGIEFCIREGIDCFEPGTQGEHKISRGFSPVRTWSAHWLANRQFSRAISDYLRREQLYMDQYIDAVNQHLPYRNAP